jgi:hypothetical protein
MVGSSSWSGRQVFILEITGSIPVPTTKNLNKNGENPSVYAKELTVPYLRGEWPKKSEG